MSCNKKCNFLNAAGIAEVLSARGIGCSERGVREMITKKKIPTFRAAFNGVHHVCEHVIDYMLQCDQARAFQGAAGRTEILLAPPPACCAGVLERADDENCD